MKLCLLTLLVLGGMLSVAWAEQQQSQPQEEVESLPTAEEQSQPEVQSLQAADEADDDDDDEEEEEEDEEDIEGDEEDDYAEEEVDVEKVETTEGDRHNPCIEKVCRRGEICSVDKKHRARCICIPQCRESESESESDSDDRFKVCSRRNVTYQSECELDRDHCLCRRQLEGCSTPNTGRIRLDYYGPCQELAPCSEREFSLFPDRMREWLYVVMHQMAQRHKIPEYLEMLELARHEGNHSHAVIWKFCDLDVDPHDRFISRRELLFTVQSLKALEHCILPFLDHCDTDSDSRITLWEWGRCLGLDEEKIKDECKSARKAADEEQK